jgi:hypothetical protein
MTPVFFADQNEFRKWLEANHKTKPAPHALSIHLLFY